MKIGKAKIRKIRKIQKIQKTQKNSSTKPKLNHKHLQDRFSKYLPIDNKYKMVKYIIKSIVEIIKNQNQKYNQKIKSAAKKSSRTNSSNQDWVRLSEIDENDEKCGLATPFANLSEDDVSYVNFNQNHGFAFIEFTKNQGDLSKLCNILNKHVWKIRLENYSELDQASSSSSSSSKKQNPKQNFLKFKISSCPYLTWHKLNKKSKQIQQNSFSKLKSNFNQENSNLINFPGRENQNHLPLGLTFDDDTAYTIKADSDGSDGGEVDFPNDLDQGNATIGVSETFRAEKSTATIATAEDSTQDHEEISYSIDDNENHVREEPLSKRRKFDNTWTRLESFEGSPIQNVEEREVETTSTAPIFNLNLIYKIQDQRLSIKLSSKAINKKLKLYRKAFYKYNLQYIDFSYSVDFVFLRFNNAKLAQQALLNEPNNFTLIKVSGEEELDYWKHILACWSDCRINKSRNRSVSKRYKSVDNKKELEVKVGEHNDRLAGLHVQLY